MRILRPGFKEFWGINRLLILSKEELMVFWKVPVMSNNVVCNFHLSWPESLGIVKLMLFFFFNKFIYLFIYGCVGSSFLCKGFL